ncbi:related to Y.lipolytica GPR1 protein and Fun34p [Ramularia collo-cygni]|uniref:Related to Y.lipolytica GPR1 protein and Fun34p n=1 Tax=Ramularia collo-cygni TaxID=112498 RepID=A0A2D3VN27_9PEZI|nr:related to Y.lipolytica GPR1 protein and Fun34p [Ramularia collo-cygni]CZT24254.1 related to Y.lipolytica GPR1 protein and Fun34p [Ramularia collo-cygni]
MTDKNLENGHHVDYANAPYSQGNGASLQQTATNTTLTNEQFERLYLSPRNQPVAGNLRKTFANPTVLGVAGFAVGLTPLSAQLMGWRGAGGGTGDSQATVGATVWFGGMCLIIAGILEFFLGNTFPFLVFVTYGAHFLTYGVTFIPAWNAVSAYNGGSPYAEGTQEQTAAFAAGFAFYACTLCVLSFIFLIASLRTNLVFFLVFVAATIGFGLAAGAFWNIAEGKTALGLRLVVGAGGSFWGAAMLGWYLLAALLFQIMEMPFPELPIVDLSEIIKAKKSKVV